MNKRLVNLAFVLLTIPSSNWAEQSTMKVATSLAPPYQELTNGQLSGSLVTLTRCALTGTQSNYTLELLPPRRALHAISLNQIDMLFSLSDSIDHSALGIASAPMLLEKWYWFSSKRHQIDPQSSIAVVAGTGEEEWLRKQFFSNIVAIKDLNAGFKMLKQNRVDAVLTDLSKANAIANKAPTLLSNFDKTFARFSTQYAVFSHQFASQNEQFLSTFNKALLNCQPIGLSLDKETIEVLGKLALSLQSLVQSPEIRRAIERQFSNPVAFDLNQTLAKDKLWREQAQQSADPFGISENPLSQLLREYTSQHDPVITEIIVTDNVGRNIGITENTSDYWQGDEESFLSVLRTEEGTIHFRDIYYDLSTELFQTQISLSVNDRNAGFYGVIIVGINLENVFSNFAQP